METHSFSVRSLHLAAYIKEGGARLVGVGGESGREFLFESPRPLKEWQLEHANSHALRVDRALMSLRALLPQQS